MLESSCVILTENEAGVVIQHGRTSHVEDIFGLFRGLQSREHNYNCWKQIGNYDLSFVAYINYLLLIVRQLGRMIYRYEPVERNTVLMNVGYVCLLSSEIPIVPINVSPTSGIQVDDASRSIHTSVRQIRLIFSTTSFPSAYGFREYNDTIDRNIQSPCCC